MVKKSETAGRFSKIKTSLKASSLKRGLIPFAALLLALLLVLVKGGVIGVIGTKSAPLIKLGIS